MVSKIQNACLNNVQHSDGDEIFQITVIYMPKNKQKTSFFKITPEILLLYVNKNDLFQSTCTKDIALYVCTDKHCMYDIM